MTNLSSKILAKFTTLVAPLLQCMEYKRRKVQIMAWTFPTASIVLNILCLECLDIDCNIVTYKLRIMYNM